MARGCCFDVTLRASHAVALHSLMSAFQGACCLPGDDGFSSSEQTPSRQLELSQPHCLQAVPQ